MFFLPFFNFLLQILIVICVTRGLTWQQGSNFPYDDIYTMYLLIKPYRQPRNYLSNNTVSSVVTPHPGLKNDLHVHIPLFRQHKSSSQFIHMDTLWTTMLAWTYSNAEDKTKAHKCAHSEF